MFDRAFEIVGETCNSTNFENCEILILLDLGCSVWGVVNAPSPKTFVSLNTFTGVQFLMLRYVFMPSPCVCWLHALSKECVHYGVWATLIYICDTSQ